MSDLTPILASLEDFLQQPNAEAARLFHGRGGCYPGLEWCAVDVFAPTVLMTLFVAPPEGAVTQIRNYIRHRLSNDLFNRLAVQHRYLPGAPYTWELGEPLISGHAQRGDKRFHIRYSRQNVGFFLDMESGRQWLEERAPGARILNLFSYTCVFSVVAQAAGARKVVNVDMSKAALAIGRENHRSNGLATDAIEFMPLNILKSWSRIKKPGPYDVVIIDPPTFQKGSFIAQRDYCKVVRRLPELLADGGDVLACLNAPELDEQFLLDVFAQNAESLRFVRCLPLPEVFRNNHSRRGLKLLHFRMANRKS